MATMLFIIIGVWVLIMFIPPILQVLFWTLFPMVKFVLIRYLLTLPDVERIKGDFHSLLQSKHREYLQKFFQEHAYEEVNNLEIHISRQLKKTRRMTRIREKFFRSILKWDMRRIENNLLNNVPDGTLELILSDAWGFSCQAKIDVPENIQNLREILKREGFKFRDRKVLALLILEREYEKYEEFKRKIASKNLKLFEDFANSYLDVCGSSWRKHIGVLIKVLREEGMIITRKKAIQKIQNMKNETAILDLKQKLDQADPASKDLC